MYDIDKDGILDANDILTIQSNIVPSSIIGHELDILARHYLDRIALQNVKRIRDIINQVNFSILVCRSCLIDEIKQRLLSKPRT